MAKKLALTNPPPVPPDEISISELREDISSIIKGINLHETSVTVMTRGQNPLVVIRPFGDNDQAMVLPIDRFRLNLADSLRLVAYGGLRYIITLSGHPLVIVEPCQKQNEFIRESLEQWQKHLNIKEKKSSTVNTPTLGSILDTFQNFRLFLSEKLDSITKNRSTTVRYLKEVSEFLDSNDVDSAKLALKDAKSSIRRLGKSLNILRNHLD